MEQRKMQTSYEAYGVECGEGWKGLYAPLIELCNLKGVTIMQVKEKFGGLRFYSTADAELQVLIDAAEAYSYRTCEKCGEDGNEWIKDDTSILGSSKPLVTTSTSRSSGWIRSLCTPCREAWDTKREAETAELKARMEAKKEAVNNEKSIPS